MQEMEQVEAKAKSTKEMPLCNVISVNLKGHTKENCRKLVGYPQDYKAKKKLRHEGSNTTYNVSLSSHDYPVDQNGYYTKDAGQSVTVSSQMTQLSHLGNAAFTKEQYEQILQLINKNNSVNTSTESANVTSAGSLYWKGEGDWEA